MQQRSDNKNILSCYFDESGSDIEQLDEIVKYYDSGDGFIYSTEKTIKNDCGATIYSQSGSDIKGVFFLTKSDIEGNQSIDYYFQNSSSLNKLSYASETQQITLANTISRVAFQDDILFYLHGTDLYCRKLTSNDQITNGTAFALNSANKILVDSNIKDIVFSNINTSGNRCIYVLTDKLLYRWEYSIIDDVVTQLENIQKRTNFQSLKLGDIKTNTKKFLDTKLQFKIGETIEDITKGIFNTSDSSEKFIDHGIFLYNSTEAEYNGFYEINEKSASLIPSGLSFNGVSSAAMLNGDFIIGMNGTDKGVYKVIYNGLVLVKTIYDFGAGKTYTNKVENLICNNGVPYIQNTSSWKYLIDGNFETIGVLMSKSDIKTEFKTVKDISSLGDKTYLVTDGKIYKVEKLISYKISFDDKQLYTFTDTIERLVNDPSLIRLLTKDSENLLTEYKCQRKGNDFTFSTINSKMSGGNIQGTSDQPQRYLNIIHVDNTTGSGIKFTNDNNGYYIIYNDYEISNCPAFAITNTGTISRYGGKFFVGSTTTTYSFDGIASDVSYQQMDNVPALVFHKIVPISDEKYLINSSNGLYTYSTKTQSCYKNSLTQNYDIPSLNRYRFSTEETYNYIYGNNNGEVYTSKNYRKWNKLLTFPGTKIQDLYIKNSKEYYFGTDKGLYASQYRYTLSNDIPQYTIANASQLYNSIFDQLSSIVHEVIDEHILKDHSVSSFMGYVNDEILSTSFEPIQDFYKESKLCSDNKLSVLTTNNDLVSEMYTSNVADGDVMLSVSNFLSSYQS